MNYPNDFINKVIHGDCLEVMRHIPNKSVDLICSDLPYGMIDQKWDIQIPLDSLWTHYKRIIKPIGTVVLFGSQPFTSLLVMSNLEWFKYEIIWEKGRSTGFVHAKNKPLKKHENILVFSPGTTVHKNQSSKRMTYNPQMFSGKPYKKKAVSMNTGMMNHKPSKANQDYVGTVNINNGTRYPTSIVRYSLHNVGLHHPTQKPLDLMEYLIKTYSNQGDTVLDSCCGSGGTLVAAKQTNRNYIGIELLEEYVKISQERLDAIPQ